MRDRYDSKRWFVAWGALLCVSALLACPRSAQADAPEITVSTDRQTATIGDPIQYRIIIRYDSTAHVVPPVIGQSLGKLDVLQDSVAADGQVVNGRKTYERHLRLAAFETGDLWIPSLQGQVVDSAGDSLTWRTDSLAITVGSVLGAVNPDTAHIRGLKSQYVVAENRWLWWTAAALAVVALVAAYWWWRRRRRKPADIVPVRRVPAWEAALKELEMMRREIDPSSDGGRLWYFRLSEILRRYFDQRYGWGSIDETTSEVMRRLANAPFDSGHRERAREFFTLADQVRYARLPTKTGRPEIDWDWVRTFVENTIPVFSEPAGGGDPGHDSQSPVPGREPSSASGASAPFESSFGNPDQGPAHPSVASTEKEPEA